MSHITLQAHEAMAEIPRAAIVRSFVACRVTRLEDYTQEEQHEFGLHNLQHGSLVRGLSDILFDEPELAAQLDDMTDDEDWLQNEQTPHQSEEPEQDASSPASASASAPAPAPASAPASAPATAPCSATATAPCSAAASGPATATAPCTSSASAIDHSSDSDSGSDDERLTLDELVAFSRHVGGHVGRKKPSKPKAPAPLRLGYLSGRLVLIPCSIYPQDACDEHGGQGWTGRVTKCTHGTATVKLSNGAGGSVSAYFDVATVLKWKPLK